MTVTEYEPAAYALAGDRWYVLDESGYVICTAAEAAGQLATAGKPAPGASASASPSASPEAATTPAPGETATPDVTDAAATGDGGSKQERLLAGPADAPLPLPGSPSPAGSGTWSSWTTMRRPRCSV